MAKTNQTVKPRTVIRKYLQHYGEQEITHLESFPQLNWQYALLIPAFAETPDFLKHFVEDVLSQDAVLLILVINQPDSLATPHPLNDQLLSTIERQWPAQWQQAGLSLHQVPETTSAMLVVDRFSDEKIPERMGVGLARKIAADLALGLHDQGQIKTPWLFCADADTRLPADYFSATRNNPNAAAITYAFQHRCENNALGLATHLYELSLHHYVDGLKRAGSPYAFHTIGSIMAVHCEHYAMVRGFPKRAGGEDFYLLNKLAKTGEVISLSKPLVTIEARLSDRVPFGTGPAVAKILQYQNPSQEFLTYTPMVFDLLATWLACMPALWPGNAPLNQLPAPVLAALGQLGVEEAIEHSRQHSKNAEGFCRHLHTWFDAFRTLKFIHALENLGYQRIPVKTAIRGIGP